MYIDADEAPVAPLSLCVSLSLPLSLSLSLAPFFVGTFVSSFCWQVSGAEQHPVQVLAKLKEIVV